MTEDEAKLGLFVDSLDGSVVAIIPDTAPFPATYVYFVLAIERMG